MADAVKYATALFTPVVHRHGGDGGVAAADRGAGLAAGLAVLGSWLAVIIAAVVAGGHDYWQGITTSTLDRPASTPP